MVLFLKQEESSQSNLFNNIVFRSISTSAEPGEEIVEMFAWLLFLVVSLLSTSAYADENSDHVKCRTIFHEYTSSPLEQKWVDNVETWQLDVCKHISNDEMNWWLGNVSAMILDNDASMVISSSPKPPPMPWSYVFSVFTYKKTCMHKTSGSSTIEYVHVPIEPTAAIARDPRKVTKLRCFCCFKFA